MATAGSIVVSLLAKTGSFETDVGRAQKRLQGLEKQAKVAAAALTAMTVAVGTAAFTAFIANTIQAENEQAQLGAVLRSTGEAAGYSRKQLNDMAGSMSMMATVSAGEINQAQTTLLAFTGIAGEEFPKALQAAIDMAARTGMSVVQAAETIGRALDIPSQGLTSLSKQGFRFTDDQKKLAERLEATGKTAEAQGIILSALEESYGGAALAARDTFGGAIAALSNKISDLLTGEEGSFDGLTAAINQVTDLLDSEEAKQAFGTFNSLMEDMGGMAATTMDELVALHRVMNAVVQGAVAVTEMRRTMGTFSSAMNPFSDTGAKDVEASVKAMESAIKRSNDAVDALVSAPRSRYRDQWQDRKDGNAWDIDLGGIPLLSPNVIRPSGSGGGGKSGSTKKDERPIVFNNMEQLLEMLGEDGIKAFEGFELQGEKTMDAVGEFALEAARNIQSSLGDGLYDILTGNFDNIGSKFGDMLMRMAADAAAANLAGALFGDYDKSGQIGGILGNLAGSLFGNSSGNLSGSSLSGASWGTKYTFDSGGFTGHGGKYEPAGIVHKGEVVFSQDDVRRNGGVSRVESMRLRGYSGGGVVGGSSAAGMPSVAVNITNTSGQQVTTGQPKVSMDSIGRLVIDVMLEDLRKNGTYARQLKGAM